MPSVTLALQSQAVVDDTATYSTANGSMRAGYSAAEHLVTASRFELPADFAGSTLNSATLNLSNVVSGGSSGVPELIVGLYSRSGTTQTLPADTTAMRSVAVGSELVTFAQSGSTVVVPLVAAGRTVTVTSVVNQALTSSWLTSGFICLIWKVSSGTGQDEIFTASGLGGGANSPTLTVNYSLTPVMPTVTCDTGTFILAGQVASLATWPPKDFSATGAYAMAGGAATFHVSMACSAGSFAINGQDASLVAGGIPASPGAFVLAGSSTTFGANKVLVGESGSFLVAGSTYAEGYSRAIVGETGAFEITAGEGTLEAPGVSLTCDTGAFTLAGGDLNFTAGAPFICDTGAFLLVVPEAHQSVAQPHDTGEFVLAGGTAGFVIQPFFDAECGAFIIAGGPATFQVTPASAAMHVYFHFFVRC